MSKSDDSKRIFIDGWEIVDLDDRRESFLEK